MAQTTVSDFVIWAKHLHGDRAVAERVLALPAGETITLRVDGVLGAWRKMDDGRDGRPTRGLRPIGRTQAFWRELYAKRRGEVVSVELADADGLGGDDPPRVENRPGVGAAERAAALEAFLSVAGQGWRSDRPYGSRDELNERG